MQSGNQARKRISIQTMVKTNGISTVPLFTLWCLVNWAEPEKKNPSTVSQPRTRSQTRLPSLAYNHMTRLLWEEKIRNIMSACYSRWPSVKESAAELVQMTWQGHWKVNGSRTMTPGSQTTYPYWRWSTKVEVRTGYVIKTVSIPMSLVSKRFRRLGYLFTWVHKVQKKRFSKHQSPQQFESDDKSPNSSFEKHLGNIAFVYRGDTAKLKKTVS